MRLERKTAIITGGGSGIGRETAVLFAKEGARVVGDVNEAGGKETIDEIKNARGDGFFAKLDVTNKPQVRQVVKDTVDKYGRVDILINNAGITQDAFLTRMTDEQWARVINVNLNGVFFCTQVVAEVMMAQGSGVIVNASSIVGLTGNIGQVNYSATKAGLIGMTKTLAKELGRKGVRVNAVAPGFIKSPMTAAVPDKILEMMKEKTPLLRLGETKDVAYAYLYLASDEASFVNGAVLSVDGGLVI
jgi:3-oxoacyl-[acyl-carrier protein] reductase